MTKNLTEGNPLRLIISFSIPVLLGNLFQQFYNMADTSIVGLYLGSNALAGVGASSSVQFLILGFCFGLCTGISIPVAQCFGAGDLSSMRLFIFNGIVILGVLSFAVTGLCVFFCPQILRILNTPDDIFANAYRYLVVLFGGIPFMIIYNYLSGILRAVGDSKTPLIFLVSCTLLNLFLDVFCIVVLKMGVIGASFATVFSQGVCGILCFIYIWKKIGVLKLGRLDCIVSTHHVRILVANGLPMGLQFSITAIGSIILQTANNSLGSVYISSFTVVTKLKPMFFSPIDALGVAVSTFASQNMGARKKDRIVNGLVLGTVIGVLYGICVGILFSGFGKELAMLFVRAEETDVIVYAWQYEKALGIFYWVIGFLNIWRPSVQSLGYSGKAMFAGFFELFARCFVTYMFVPKFGYDAICFADPMAWIFSTAYLIPVMLYCLKKIK